MAGVVLMFCLNAHTDAKDNAVLNMKANITQSACIVSTSDGKTSYSLISASADDIWNSTGIQSQLTKVTLKLTKCGLGLATTKPKVIITGVNAVQADFNVKNGANKYMFRDKGSLGGTAREFFIGVSRSSKPTTVYSSTTMYAADDLIPTNNDVLGATGEGKTADIWLGLAWGDKNRTDKTKARAGSVKATLTFKMEYR